MPVNMLASWVKNLLGRDSRRSRRLRSDPRHRHGPTPRRLAVESLEERVTPTGWVVTLSTPDSATTVGTLRYALTNSVSGDTISFASSLTGATITLSSTLTISDNITIVGLGASSLAISGTSSFVDVSVSAGVTASISGLTIENGLSVTGNGIQNAGTLSLSDDTISGNGSIGNSGSDLGGGIYNSGTLNVTSSTITNNSSYYNGGGIYNTGTATVSNSTISGNYAFTYGGGIYNAGTLTLVNATISGNLGWDGSPYFPEEGGGIENYYSGTLQMTNTIVAGNGTAYTYGPDIAGAVVAGANNLVGDGTGMTGLTNGSNGNQVGTAGSPINPLLGALASNGGPTQTQALQTGSPAIGAGAAVTTVGTGGIAATGNTITVTNGADIALTTGVAVVIQIDSEQMLVTGASGNTLTVVRGYNGTTSAAHLAGANVFLHLDQRGDAITTTTPDIGAYQSTGTAPTAPTVSSVNPTSGPTGGGTSVTITGTNLSNATAVFFGAIPGTIVSDSGTVIVAITPVEPAATVDTTVTTVGWDTSSTSTADHYTFVASGNAPTVTPSTSNIPDSSTTLTITGTNFSATPANNTVLFNLGVAGTVTASTATQLTVTLTTPPTSLGSLTAVVTSNGNSSGSPVQVASEVSGTWIVTSNSGTGGTLAAITLPYAVTHALNGDSITFASGLSGSTITLSSTLTISHSYTIVGLGATSLAVSGTSSFVDISVSSGVTTSISGLTVENGLSDTGNGIRNAGTLTLTNDAISNNGTINNTGSNQGGGIYNSGTMAISGSTITGNSSYYNGGGIDNTGTLTLSNSTVASNYAYTYGGGIYNTGTMTLSDDTIAANSGWDGVASYPEDGGGIFTSGTATMNNTIVANDTTTGAGPDIYGTIATGNNDLIGNSSGLTISSGTGNILNPTFLGLSAVGNYGGTTQTYALLPGSPAINAGSNSLAVGSTDQRGNSRLVGGTVDIGAVESQGFTLGIVSGNNQTTPTNAAFTNPLVVSVTAINSVEPVNGGKVTFTVTPSGGGAGATLTTSPATIGGGQASVTATANATAGSYTVTASDSGASSATFSLTNAAATSTYSESLNSGALTITQAVATANDNLSFTLSGGNYTFTDTGGLTFGTPTGTGAASISGAGTSTITIPSSAVTSITVTLGTGTNVFTFTGTNSLTAAPLIVNTGTTTGDQAKITGAVLDSGALTLTSNTIALNGGSVTTTGAQTYNDPVTLGANTTLTSTGSGNLTFASTVNGAFTLATSTVGTTIFSGAVGATTALVSLTAAAAGTTRLSGGTVTTTGNQTYNDPVALGANTTINSANVTFASTVNTAVVFSGSVAILSADTPTTGSNANVLANVIAGSNGVLTSSNVTVIDVYGSTPSLATLDNYSSVMVYSNYAYSNATTLGTNLASYVNQGHGVVTATFNNYDVTGATLGGTWNTGGYEPYTGFAFDSVYDALGTIAQPSSPVIAGVTTFSEYYHVESALTANDTLIASYASGYPLAVQKSGFAGTIIGLNMFPPSNAISAYSTTGWTGQGALLMANALIYAGSTITPSSLTVNASGATTFGGVVGGINELSSLTVASTGTTAINGGSVTTTGAQTYNNPVTLGANTTLTSTSSGNLTLASTVNGAFTLATSTGGTTTFGGVVGGTTALTSVTTPTTGTTAITGGGVTTTGAQTYNDPVTLGANTTLTSTGSGNLTFASTVNGAFALATSTAGTTNFSRTVGTTTALVSLTTAATGTTILSGGTVTTTGNQTYNDPVTLGVSTTINGANVTFTSTVNATAVSSYSVALLYADTGSGDSANVTSSLISGSNGLLTSANVTAINVGSTTPTLATLDTYAAVFVYSNSGYSNYTTLGNNLASYVAQGHGVVTATFDNIDEASYSLGGTWASGGYAPYAGITSDYATDSLGTIAQPSSPVMTGVTAFTNYYHFASTLTANDTLIASYTSGYPLAVQKGGFTGKIIGLNMFPPSSALYGADGWTGNGAQLMANSLIYAGNIVAPASLTVNGTGTTTFGGVVGGVTPLASLTVAATGTTAINGGSVTSTGAQTYNNAVTLGANTTLTSTTSGNITLGSTVNGAFTLSVSTAGTTKFSGVVGGTTALTSVTVAATGTTTLNGGSVTTTGAQTYNNPVTLGANTTLSSTGSGNISFGSTVNGAFTLVATTTGTTSFAAAVGGTTALTSLTVNTTNVTAGAIATTAGVTVNNTGAASSITGVISGAAAPLTKTGTGTLTLSGTNTYGGITTISGGVLSISSDANLGTDPIAPTPGKIVLSGGTLQATASFTLNTNRGTALGPISGSGSGTIDVTGSNTLSYNGIITNNGSGTGGLTKIDSGTLTLSGANTYTGATTVNGGTLQAGTTSIPNTSGAFGDNSAVIMANTAGATLNITGFNTQIGSLTGGGTTGGNVILGAATLTVGGDNTSPAAYAGVISGTGGSVTKIGTGTLNLTGASTYTGATTVSAGTLAVNGSITSSVTNSGTLQGSGTITGNVSGSGTFSPGNTPTPGIMTINGNFTPSGTLVFKVNTPFATAGTDYDQFSVSGTVNLTGSTLTLTNNIAGTFPTLPGLLTLISHAAGGGLTTGGSPPDGSSLALGSNTVKLFYNGNDGNDVVIVNAIAPTIGYTSASFAGDTNGTLISDADLGTAGNQPAIYGVNAFTTIGAALGAITSSGQVIINSGTYAEAVNLTGTQTLTITGVNVAGAVTINSLSTVSGTTVQIQGSSSLTDGNATSTTVAGAITGGGGLTKVGTGTLTLSGANSYGGPTTISGGVLSISSDANLGSDPATPTPGDILLNGGTLQATASFTLNSNRGTALGPTSGSGSGTIDVTSGNTLTDAGIIANDGSGTDGLTEVDSGTLILSGANTYTGATTVSGGTLTAGIASVANTSGAFGNNSAVILANTAGVTLNITGFNTQIGSLTGGGTTGGNVTLGSATLAVGGDNTSPAAYAGVISGTGGSVTKIGTGTLNLTGASTYTGATIVGAGTLAVNGSITSSVTNSGTLQGSGTITGNVSGSGTFSPGNNPTPGIMTINGNFTPSGSVIFKVNSPYVTAGTDYDQYSVSGTVNLTGSTLTLTNNLAGTFPALPTLLTLINHAAGGGLITPGAPADGSSLALGSNTVKLFYNGNTGNDVVIVNASTPTIGYTSASFAGDTNGTLITDADLGTAGNQSAIYGVNAFSTIGAALGAITSSGQVIVNSGTYAEAVSLTGTQTLTITGVNVPGVVTINSLSTVSGTTVQIQGSSSLTDGNATSTTVAGTITGGGGLTKIGTGTLTLSGANSYGGPTTISGGILSISSDANLGSDPTTPTPGDIVLNGGTLQATASFTLNSNRGTALGPTSGSGSGTIDVTSGNTLTDAGIIANDGSGNDGLTEIDSGTLILSGANTYTGATTVSGGTLTAGIASVANTSGAFGNNSAVILANTAGVTLNITGFNTQIGSLTGGGTTGGNVTLGSATLTVGGDNTSPAAYAGVISGTGGGLTKLGTGTLNLTGASAYTGATTVSAGTLAVNGSITSSVTNSGTLQGSGTITGNVSGSGTFSPGNNPTPGIMTINGNFTPSGTVIFKVNSPYATAGTDYDQYSVSGTVNLTGSTLTLTNNIAGTFPALPTLLTLINHAAGGGLITEGTPADGSSLALGSNTVKLFYNGNTGNDVVIVNASTPTIGYTSASFAGDTNGTLITDADLGTAGNQPAIYGVNAFTTIGAALGAITSSGQVTVNSGTYAEAVNLTGTQTLTITGVNVPGAVTINSLSTVSGTTVQIQGSSSLTDGNATSTSVAGTITGGGSLTKIGTGTLTLSGANSYGGPTTISGGILSISSDANLGSDPTTPTPGDIVLNGGTLQATASFTLNSNRGTALGPTSGSGGGTIDVTSGNTLTDAGIIANDGSGTDSLTKIDNGTLNLTGASTYTGATTVSAGTLAVNGSITSSVTNSGALQGSGTITGNVTGSGTFSPGNSPTPGIMTINGNFTPSGTVIFKVNAPYATAGTDYDQYSVSGTVNLTGSTLTLTNNLAGTFPALPTLLTLINHAAGGGLITGGTPADGSSLALGSNTVKLFYNGNTGNDVVIVNATTPTIGYTSASFAGDTNGTLITDADLGTAGNQPAIYGVNAFTTIGAALGAITSSGQVIVNSGTYAEAVSLTGTQTLTITGVNVAGAVTINSLSTVSGTTVQIQGSSSLTEGNATSTTVAGTITGGGGLTKVGSGTLTITGADTYTGATTVSAGTLAVNGSITSSVTNSGTLQGSGTITGNVSGTGTFSPGNNPAPGIMTINGNFTPSGTLVFKVNAPYATAGTDYDQYSVSGTVNLTGSTITLTNNLAGTFPAVPAIVTLINHAVGGGLITGGTPADGSSLALGTNTVKLFYNGNTGNDVVIVNGAPQSVTYVSSTFAGDTNGTLITDADLGTAGNQSAIYGVNAFTTIGAASGAISSSGQVIVNSGTYAEAVTLTGTQTLTITGVNVAGAVTINSLSTVSGTTVQIQGASSLTEGNATSTTVAGTITGGGGLTETGTGTLTLTGTNTYTGATTINGGTLLVNGNDSAATGAVAVNSTGTLAGTGTLGGVVTVSSGGFISPGTVGTVGTLTVGGLNFNGGTYLADFSGNTSDTIITAGTVNLADTLQGAFSVNSQTGSTTAANIYTLIENTGAGTISNPPLSGATEGGTVTINGVTSYVTYAGGNGKSFTLTASGSVNLLSSGTLTIRKDTTDGASNIELLQGSTIIDERPLGSIPPTGAYTVTATGASTLTVDYTNSPPTPAGQFPTNIIYNGFGADILTVLNGTFGKIAYNPSTTTAETIQEYTNSGDTVPVTTISATGVSGVSDTSTNTGIAVVNLPNLLPGAGSTTFGTAVSGAGATQFAGNLAPTTGFGDPATNLAINMGATGSLTLGKMDSTFNPSSGVQVTGTTGNDTFTVNWIASKAITINGDGGTDSVTINSGKSGGAPGSLGSGEVALTGISTYTATVNGSGNDIIDVNDQNHTATSPPPAPSGAPVTGLPAITTGSGVASVATNGVDVLNYSAGSLPTLYLGETTGTNTYNIQFPKSVSGSLLPPTITIQTATTTDTANLFGATKPTTFDVGFTTAGTTTVGSNAVTYPEGNSAYLQTLNVYGGDGTGTIGDTFKVYPDAHTAVNINAGLPGTGSGDTLILNAFGLINPAIIPLYNNTSLPNGEITSGNKATLNWNSIETFPIPLGLGGTFQFLPNGSATQPGFLPVYSTDTPSSGQYANADDGWLDAGAGSFDRSTLYNGANIPNSPKLASLLESGEWGYASSSASGSTNDGEFQVSVAPNQPIQVTTYMGDTYQGRQDVNVYVGTPANPYETLLNPSSTTFTTANQNYQYVSYSGMFNPGSSSLLEITFQTVAPGQFWTVSGVDVRPLGLIAPLTITRADSAPLTTPQLANGTTVDTYSGAGAAPYAEVTITPSSGTPYGTDADPSVAGFQVMANASGNFTFQILRPTGIATSLISVEDVTGASATGQVGPTGTGGLAVSSSPYMLPSPVYQSYALPSVRQIDFGPLGTPAASDSDQDVVSAAITTAGTGYTVGDLLTVQGGTSYTAAQLQVTSVGGTGNITGVSVLQVGDYLTTPTNPVSVTDSTTPAASGATFTLGFGSLNYLVFANAAYTSTAANALGWIGTAPTPFDRGSSYNNLQRDGVYGTASTPGLFELDMPAANTTYSVTVLLGDAAYPESGMYIEAINPITLVATTIATGVATPAGQSTSFTFPVTTDSSGRIQLEFGVVTTPSNGFWTLQDVEVRPEVATGTPPVGTQVSLTANGTKYTGSSTGTGMAYSATSLTGTVPADGMTSTTYTITGANPNALLTITTSLGTLTSSDVGTTYTGTQVQASATGTATFTITSPLSASATTTTIAVTDVTGAALGVFTQTYSGYSPPPPPTSPPGTFVDRFDFTTGGSPAQSGFTSVPNKTVYSATTGYGWVTAVNGYDRGAGSVPAGYPQNLFRAGAWGQGSGTFEVSVPAGSTDDVRVYVGDPYNAWSGITVSVDGGTPVAVNPVLDQYGFVTVYGVTDTQDTGLLSITISGPVWVASGMDVASTGGLPTPATGLATPVSSARLEFASTAISGFTAVPNTATYTPALGYGWQSAVNSFVRPASEFPAGSTLTPTQMQFYGSGAWDEGSTTFEFAVPLGSSATYSVRAYVSDPYNAWGGITLSGEGASTSLPVTASNGQSDATTTIITLTGLTDLNGDGVISVTVNGPVWVLNGLEIVQGGLGNLPAQPQLASVTGPAPGAAPVVPLTAAQLAPIAAAAVARWEEAGITPAQDALLKSVQYSIGNLSTQGALGLTVLGSTHVELDATADGRGWFIDPTPGTDAEFTQVASTEEVALPNTAAAAHYDLLTVVEHELGHVLGLGDQSNSAAPTNLMAADLAPGVRRLPDAAAVSHPSAPVSLLSAATVSQPVATVVPVSLAVSAPGTIGSIPAGLPTAPQQWLEMTPTALAETVFSATPPTSLVSEAIPLAPTTRTSLAMNGPPTASNIPGWLPPAEEANEGETWLLSGVLVG